jgi:hypothetical protein
MSTVYTNHIVFYYRQTHERLLSVLEDLSDAQLAWQAVRTAHAIAWNLWHLARWADILQEAIPQMTPVLGERLGPRRQIWEVDGLAARWGLAAGTLGYRETGMLMDDDAAACLVLPNKAELIGYARRAFAAARQMVGAIDDAQWQEPDGTNVAYYAGLGRTPPRLVTVGGAVLEHVSHENRHLGEIECVRGLQGMRGTATQ